MLNFDVINIARLRANVQVKDKPIPQTTSPPRRGLFEPKVNGWQTN